MKKNNSFTFEEIFKQNERRIHYHIHKLNIRDPHQDFFQEGLVALWNAYKTHEPDKGPMATYFNFTIRNRLIDKVRKDTRLTENDEKVIMKNMKELDDGNHFSTSEAVYPLVDTSDIPVHDSYLWNQLKDNLTTNQWKWIDYYIVKDMSIKEIANLENKSEDAVKSWGRQARKKLRNEKFREKLGLDINDQIAAQQSLFYSFSSISFNPFELVPYPHLPNIEHMID